MGIANWRDIMGDGETVPKWTAEMIDRVGRMIDVWLTNYMPNAVDNLYQRWINEHGGVIWEQHQARAAELSNMRMKQNFLQQKIATLEEEIYQLRRERDGACTNTEGI
jgi:hypothetical protein